VDSSGRRSADGSGDDIHRPRKLVHASWGAKDILAYQSLNRYEGGEHVPTGWQMPDRLALQNRVVPSRGVVFFGCTSLPPIPDDAMESVVRNAVRQSMGRAHRTVLR